MNLLDIQKRSWAPLPKSTANRKASHAVIATLWLSGCGAAPEASNQWELPPSTTATAPSSTSGSSSAPVAITPTTPGVTNPGTPAAPVTPSSPGVTPTVGVEPSPAPGTPANPALVARTWRLTHEQYQRAIADLFDVEIDLAKFVPETGNGKFVNFSSTAFVRQDLAANYFETAKDVVGRMTTTQLRALTSCNLEASCSAAFISELGRRVFRRPAPEDLVARYQEIIDLAAGEPEEDAVEAGFRAVVVAMLNSPLFLYRTEIGAESDGATNDFELTDHEVATELSFSLLGRTPPDWLGELADTGELVADDRTVLIDAVERLLEDPAANTELGRFLTEWLEVQAFEQVAKSDEVFPGFDTVKPEMQAELAAFLDERGRQDNTLRDLLVGEIPEVSRALTDYYFSDPSAPDDASATSRAGVLGLGVVLAGHAKSYLTSPTLRGTFVRKRFFCQEITLPPGFTPPPLANTEELKTARTTRELYEQHQADPTCAPCHDLTDKIGFVLEEFDGAGRVRTLDTTQGHSEPLDLASELTSSDVNRPLNSLSDLNAALSESAQVRQCLAQQAFRFYFGQGETSPSLPPIIAGSAAVEGSTLGALLSGLFTTESTYVRQREPSL
jgi:hypothetical protein